MIPAPVIATVLGFVLACTIVDVRTRRIPNLLSGTALLSGLLMSAAYGGWDGFLGSLAAALAVVVVLLPAFALGGIGAGDVKMMAAVAALLGLRLGFAALGVGMLFGGLLMIVHLVRIGRLREKLVATGRMLIAALGTRSSAPLRVTASHPGAVSLPYSVPMALGTALVVLGAVTRAGH